MNGWTVEAIIGVSALVFAGLCLAWAATFGLRALLKENSPEQPDDSPTPPTKGVVRCRPRVVLGDPRLLSTPLAPGSGS